MVDELAVKRQETPLLMKILTVNSSITFQISSIKLLVILKSILLRSGLFKFLFNHIRLNLAVPLILRNQIVLQLLTRRFIATNTFIE